MSSLQCGNTSRIWLILAVDRGMAACAQALIDYGVEVVAADGTAWNATQNAQSHLDAEHPRREGRLDLRPGRYVSAEEDQAVLDVLQAALKRRSQDLMPERGHRYGLSTTKTVESLPQSGR